jgi:hypothetical protein
MANCHPERKHQCRGLCASCYMKDFRSTRPEYREYMRKYLAKYQKDNKEKLREQDRIRKQSPRARELDREYKRRHVLRRKYGITAQIKVEMLSSQGEGCAICFKPLTYSSGHVDHDHSTGKVRGILCLTCNAGLGQFGDSKKLLMAALSYLDKSATIAEIAKEP